MKTSEQEARVSRIQQIQREHEAIYQTMNSIVRELDQLASCPAKPGERWGLPGLVRSFRTHLLRHFELEENGGLLGDATQYYGRETQHTVAQLITQHRNFERRLNQILSELDSSILPPVTVQGCYDRDLRRLMDDLRAHEGCENVLFEEIVGLSPSSKR